MDTIPDALQRLPEDKRLRAVMCAPYLTMAEQAHAIAVVIWHSEDRLARVLQLLTEWGTLERDPNPVPMTCEPLNDHELNLYRRRNARTHDMITRSGSQLGVEDHARVVHDFLFAHQPTFTMTMTYALLLLLETGLRHGRPASARLVPCAAA